MCTFDKFKNYSNTGLSPRVCHMVEQAFPINATAIDEKQNTKIKYMIDNFVEKQKRSRDIDSSSLSYEVCKVTTTILTAEVLFQQTTKL